MMRWIVAVAVTLLIAIGGLTVAWQNWLDAPLRVPAAGYVLDVPSGGTLTRIADQLARDDILDRPWLLRLSARVRGQERAVRAGEYDLPAEISPAGLLDMLVAGRVKLHSLTIVEGWTVKELLAAMNAHPAISRTLSAGDPVELAQELELAEAHAEGLFFPDTYRFARGTSDEVLLRQAYDLMTERLVSAWAQRREPLPMQSAYEALILASVIERETALDTERPQIAGVFVRRLERGMRLQTDPTVIYGLGDSFDGNLRRRDLTTDTPYNTYTRGGLPPTPIGLPGAASLLAAVQPADGDALYFVATGDEDGSHSFSATLEEHNAAVARYLRVLRERRNEG
ncbi:MAG: endolytic transglycosylase MltG [Gammaproteobacteria bacterium]|nr:endolytic transglycosylase MltG [Gammaproteobacteria bacterium]